MNTTFTDTEVRDAFRAFRMERGGAPTGMIEFKPLNDRATIPTYGSNGAAGLDLYALLPTDEDTSVIDPGGRGLFKTGISAAIPRGFYGRVAPRSGLAYKHGIDVLAGVIDEDYRGEIGVILINHGYEPFHIRHADRIAQLIITQYLPCLPIPCSELSDTVRGEGAFGSTGR